MKNIQKIGVILRPNSPYLRDELEKVVRIFNDLDIQIILESLSAQMLGMQNMDFEKLQNLKITESCILPLEQILKTCDLLLTIGGDGTLIAAVRASFHTDIAILGLNTGRLGFLTSIAPSNLPDFAHKIKNGEFDIRDHMMLECEILRPNKPTQRVYALNEFLISRRSVSGLIDIQAKINGAHFNNYFCDALIIATPTGSTAYNISAGGSVVYPYCQNILLTPMAAHSLTQRPLIVDSDTLLEFGVLQSGFLITDGQNIVKITPNDRILIHKSPKPARLVYPKGRSFFDILREKFNWGER